VASSCSTVINVDGDADFRALFSPREDRTQPVAALWIVGCAADFAEGLPADALQIIEPRFVYEIITRAVFEQFSIGELILPFDVKGLAPERIAPFDLDSHVPIHCLSLLLAESTAGDLLTAAKLAHRRRGCQFARRRAAHL
jgi:hypothetical protein